MSVLAGSAAERHVDHRRAPKVHGFDDLGIVDPLEVHGRDAEVAVAELALDDHERYAFVGEFDGVRMAQLVWGKAAADAGGRGAVT